MGCRSTMEEKQRDQGGPQVYEGGRNRKAVFFINCGKQELGLEEWIFDPRVEIFDRGPLYSYDRFYCLNRQSDNR